MGMGYASSAPTARALCVMMQNLEVSEIKDALKTLHEVSI